MARRSEGQVVERHWKSGRGYALRFRAYGERQYLTLGLETEGWDRERAEEELANVMADVRRGFWTPPTRRRRSEESRERGLSADCDLLFGPFARRVVAQREGEVSASYFRIMHWGLSHLLPYFADWPLAEIDVEAVDAYRAFKVEESESIRRAIERRKPKLDEHGRPRRPLNATSINKTLKLLQWVLSIAVEYEHIDRNPAEGRRRRLPEPKHAPVHLDTVEQIQALLDACALLDRSPKRRSEGRVAVISTLLFAGPRAEELCNLLWRDVDLANGRIHIGRSKTQAGLREIDLLPVLRDTLATHKANAYRSGPDDLVFPTETGGRRDRNNLRSRTLGLAIKHADELLAKRGQPSLPRGLTTHKLRHTFASILVACGEDPASVMAQLGHAHPAFTLRVYTHLMRRGTEERARLKALVQGEGAEAMTIDSLVAEEAGS
jgi:integrase